MRFFRLLACVLSFATVAQAEAVDPNTRLGLAEVVEGADGIKALRLGDQIVALPTEPWIAFLAARRGDLLLVGLSQGGNACGAHYAWGHATPGDLRVSKAFGTCNALLSVRHDAETVAVRLKSVEPGQGDQGSDYWVGHDAADLLHAAKLQPPCAPSWGTRPFWRCKVRSA